MRSCVVSSCENATHSPASLTEETTHRAWACRCRRGYTCKKPRKREVVSDTLYLQVRPFRLRCNTKRHVASCRFGYSLPTYPTVGFNLISGDFLELSLDPLQSPQFAADVRMPLASNGVELLPSCATFPAAGRFGERELPPAATCFAMFVKCVRIELPPRSAHERRCRRLLV